MDAWRPLATDCNEERREEEGTIETGMNEKPAYFNRKEQAGIGRFGFTREGVGGSIPPAPTNLHSCQREREPRLVSHAKVD